MGYTLPHWHGEATEGPLPRAKFHFYRGKKCGNTAPKTVKISNFGHKFTPQGQLVWTTFYEILRFCTRL